MRPSSPRCRFGLGGVVPVALLLGLLALGATHGLPSRRPSPCSPSLSHVAGMLVERWLFFAEARHAVMNYYGG